LESRGFEVLLVAPPQGQQMKGRPKSHVHDGQWLQRLHPFGLLASACRPPDPVCVRRSDLRQRAMLLSYASQHLQHRHKALTPRNLKLQPVVSAVTGETGMASMRAMLGGERAPGQLAHLRKYRCQPDEATIAKALCGQWRDEPLFAWAQAVALDAMDHQKIAACDRQIAAHLGTCAERAESHVLRPVVRPRKRTRHRPPVDVRGALPRMTGVDLTAIAGSDEPTALTILSERGLDRGRWPTVKHFTCWLGLCPHHRVAGGKV
jgi:hypothetical protein